MRILIGIACAVVIAAGGFWLWQQYDSYQQQRDTDSVAARKAQCIEATRRFVANIRDHAEKDACEKYGYITPSEIEAITDGRM